MKSSRFLFDCVALFVITLEIVVAPRHAIAQRPMGTDVSSYQGGGLNWTTIKNDGISFAWAKACEGIPPNYGEDADFTINETNAKTAGVPIGAYYFAHPEHDTGTAGADTEAAYFWSIAGPYIVGGGTYLMPMLDMEVDTGTQASMSTWVNEWCQDIVNYAAAKGVVVKPVVYASTSYASTYFNSTVTQWNSWLAAYPDGTPGNYGSPCPQTCSPGASAPWSTWSIWQYGDTNWSGGDSDVYNGTMAQFLQTFLISGNVASAGAALYWDPAGKKASPGSGGSGSWDISTADWWLSGSSNLIWSPNGDNPVFAGTAGTVTLNAGVSAGSVKFNTAGYAITGTANTLTLTNPATISVPPPGTSPVNISCILSGAGYTVTGGGVLVLNNAANSSLSPISIVSNTTLVIATSRALGTGSGTVTISGGGSLQNNDTTSGDAFLSSSFNIVMGTGGGYVNDNINANLSYGGVISGSGNLTKIGGGGGTGGTLVLNGANTYTGNTVISQGVLALGSTGSINNSPSLTIAAGATLDVSAIANWTLNSSAVLTASGTGTTVAVNAAAIKGAAASGASLGTQPVTLVFTPTGTNGDAAHPALYISQGILTLSHANTVSISNASGMALGGGAYTLIQQASGSISGAPYPTPLITGAGVVSGARTSLSVSGGSVILSVTNPTSTTLNALSPSTYGQSVTFTATVAPSPTGGTVQFYDNGVALGSAATVSGGTASYTANALSVGNHPITAAYSGAGFYAASSTVSASTQQVSVAPLSITASAQSKTYGQTLVFGSGSISFSSVGLQTGDTIGTVTLTVSSNGGAATAPVSGSPYTITPSAATGGTFNPGNYNITYNTGLLTVHSASLTVAADNFTRPYGATNPTFTVTYSNFVNGETLGTSDVAGSPVLSTSATTNSPAGVYDITNSLGTLTSTNYAFNLVDGTLTVTSNSLVITSISILTNGSVQLNFSGTAGGVYLIEAATDLTPPIVWTTLSTNTADTNGVFSFTDVPVTNYNGRYYRMASQ